MMGKLPCTNISCVPFKDENFPIYPCVCSMSQKFCQITFYSDSVSWKLMDELIFIEMKSISI